MDCAVVWVSTVIMMTRRASLKFFEDDSENHPGCIGPEFNNLFGAARIEPNPDNLILLLQRSDDVLLNDPIVPRIYLGRTPIGSAVFGWCRNYSLKSHIQNTCILKDAS